MSKNENSFNKEEVITIIWSLICGFVCGAFLTWQFVHNLQVIPLATELEQMCKEKGGYIVNQTECVVKIEK